jgi:hypothetical protein
MRIGLGGGAASSMTQGTSSAELDFASVQRANAEVERRCQEVLDGCQALGAHNPILAVHDVGAGGLSNALPELCHGAGVGGRIELRRIPNAEPGMTPLEIWCNEAQERYVLAVAPADLPAFEALCRRERCPYAVVGHTTALPHLLVSDELLGEPVVDLPLEVVLGRAPRTHRDVARLPARGDSWQPPAEVPLLEWARRVLAFPAVADKTFLVTIGDRSITGMVARDPMVGPWQVPVADVAVTTVDYRSTAGEAMAVGERPALALLDPAASGRMAITEALTNLLAADVRAPEHVQLSLNWMAACGPTARTRRCTTPCAPPATCAWRSASRSPWARTRCPCGRRGQPPDGTRAEVRAPGDPGVHRVLGGGRHPPHAVAVGARRRRRTPARRPRARPGPARGQRPRADGRPAGRPPARSGPPGGPAGAVRGPARARRRAAGLARPLGRRPVRRGV